MDKPRLYLIREAGGKRTLWDIEKATETGYVLIDISGGIANGVIRLNYSPKEPDSPNLTTE